MDTRVSLKLITNKKTAKKIRWGIDVEGVAFELYIPQWRVPKPWPDTIYVSIKPVGEKSTSIKVIRPGDVLNNPNFRQKPIETLLEFDREHTETIRYSPLGDSNEWEIGQPYIPFSLTYNWAPKLKIKVFWGE